jgi:hypothetical protein
MNYVLAALVTVFAIIRFQIPTHTLSSVGAYEAFAHLFVGGLFGAAMAAKKWNYFWFALALTIIEVIAFFTRHAQ